MDEGCLSLPGVLVDVERPVHVRVRARDEHGEALLDRGLRPRGARHPARDRPPRRRPDPRPHAADQRKQAMRELRERCGVGRSGLSRARPETCGPSTSGPRTSPPRCSTGWRRPSTGPRSSSRGPTPRAGAGASSAAPPVADAARALGIELIQPEDLHAAESLDADRGGRSRGRCASAPTARWSRSRCSRPTRSSTCTRRCCRAGAAPRRSSGRSWPATRDRACRSCAWWPGSTRARSACRSAADRGRRRLRHRRRAARGPAASCSARDLLGCARWTSRRRSSSRTRSGVRYAEKITARDRDLDPTRRPSVRERRVRALRPHIGARLALPDGGYLGVWSARVGGPTLAAAGGRVRTDGERLLLDCDGGALELLEVQPPGGRRMAAAEWLRGRPDPAPDRLLDGRHAAAHRARRADRLAAGRLGARERVGAVPGRAVLARRPREVLDAMRELGALRRSARARRRRLRARPARSADALVRRPSARGELERARRARARRRGAGDGRLRVRHTWATSHGLEVLLALRDHPDP